jgi:hypothetical protein
VRYVVGARVLRNLAQAVSKKIVLFVFYGIFAESTIKCLLSKRSFCVLNISAEVHSIELKISGEEDFTETYMSHKFELQQFNRCFPTNVDIGGKNAFFDRVRPLISRDWRLIETPFFAHKNKPMPATGGIKEGGR